jgi:hypothetical protein
VFAICYGTTQGLGLHQTDVSPKNDVALNTAEYVANVLYVSFFETHKEEEF